jgi:TetR/AcrR family transcriptional regulator, cholesterol catabolism regulator
MTQTRTSRDGEALTALTDGSLASAAQRDRRKRIIEATLALASKGGFDAVQMRTVAERADVALGTLYRYFPSKIHLLVSGLDHEFERAQSRLDRTTIPGNTPDERVRFVLGRITRALQRDPNLTEAMTRAFMFADASVAVEVHGVVLRMEQMFVRAMHGADHVPSIASEEDQAIARVIGDVWLASLVAWVTGRASASDVAREMDLAVRLLLR